MTDPELTIAGIPRSKNLEDELSYLKIPGWAEKMELAAFKHMKQMGIKPERIPNEDNRAKYIKYLKRSEEDSQ